jgi:CHAD domain-containing protein
VLGPIASPVRTPALDRRSTIEDVVRVAVLDGVDELLAHEPFVRLNCGADDVHDARVATRRLRSNLRTLRPVLDRSTSERLRDELSWAGALLGTVRDLDVMRSTIETFLAARPAVAGHQLLALIDGEREAAHRCLVASMRDPRWQSMMRRLEAAARLAPLRGTVAPMDHAEPTARALLRKSWRRCEQRALGAQAGETSWHEVRKAAKSTRYAAELFEPVLGRPAGSFARATEAIQERLGEIQDLVVACEWLRRHVDDPQVGVVAKQLCADFAESPDDLPAHWNQVWKQARRAGSRVF